MPGNRRGADPELAGHLGRRAFGARQLQHGGPGVTEQIGQRVVADLVDQRQRGQGGIDDQHRAVGVPSDHGSAGPQQRWQQRHPGAAGADIHLRGCCDLHHRAIPGDAGVQRAEGGLNAEFGHQPATPGQFGPVALANPWPGVLEQRGISQPERLIKRMPGLPVPLGEQP
jgi:hypothetical protein